MCHGASEAACLRQRDSIVLLYLFRAFKVANSSRQSLRSSSATHFMLVPSRQDKRKPHCVDQSSISLVISRVVVLNEGH